MVQPVDDLALFRAAKDHVQKKSAHAAEQDRPDILKRREAWFEGQLDLDPEKLVFIDESWASTNMARHHGRAPRGERLHAAVPHGHWQTTTFVAGLRLDGVVAPLVLDGPINAQAFEAYVEQFLAPTLRKGDIVVMDNVSSHKRAKVRELIEAAGDDTIYTSVTCNWLGIFLRRRQRDWLFPEIPVLNCRGR